MIIDMHTHVFPDNIADKVLYNLGVEKARIQPFTDGTLSALKKSMKDAGIDYSVILTVMTNTKQVEKLNGLCIENKVSYEKEGILNFGGIHPDYKDYKTQCRLLASHGIHGIKLHPSYQGVNMDDIRYLRIIDAASEAGLAVVVHAGIDIGIYDHNYCSVEHILKVMEEVHPEKFILAHMGNWGYWDEVEQYLCGAPVWLDTSYSLGKIYPNPLAKEAPITMDKLSDEAFLRIIRKHGTDRILFGTDCPWGDQKMEVEHMKNLPLTKEEQEQIFYKNALEILSMNLNEKI